MEKKEENYRKSKKNANGHVSDYNTIDIPPFC